MTNKFQTGGTLPGKIYLSSELYDMKVPINLEDPVLEGLNAINEQVKRIQEEQERELSKYLKDYYCLVGSPLIKAQLEQDTRFKDCKIFCNKYVDPKGIFIIRRVSLGILGERI